MMNRCSFSAMLALFALSVAPLAGCIKDDVQLGGPAAATWEGYVENYKFQSGSNKVIIDLGEPQGSSVTGTVRLGDAPDLPPATDPDVGYPPGLSMSGWAWDGMVPYEGFDFTFEDGTLAPDQLTGTIDGDELWNSWCGLQTSYQMEPGSDAYRCVPNGPTELSDSGCKDDGVPIDCNKLQLCQYLVCACDASGCEAGHAFQPLGFDLHIEGDEAHGSVMGLSGQEPLNLWLTRAAAQ